MQACGNSGVRAGSRSWADTGGQPEPSRPRRMMSIPRLTGNKDVLCSYSRGGSISGSAHSFLRLLFVGGLAAAPTIAIGADTAGGHGGLAEKLPWFSIVPFVLLLLAIALLPL